MQEPRWTLDELAERVDLALAVDYHGQPSGRVRAVPDRRAIRWYTTIGLIDRPVAHRGRTALYGPRHLLQLVAVKRLQAKGLPLVAIQQELAGATDSQLARVARIPGGALPTAPSGPVPAVAVPDGGDLPLGRVPDRPGAAGTPRPAATAQPPAIAPRVAGVARRASFWRDRPAAAFAATDVETATEAARTTGATEMPEAPEISADPGDARVSPGDPGVGSSDRARAPATGSDRPTVIGPRRPTTLHGVRLGAGATLLVEPGRELDAADLDAILDAARPLLAVLRERGLDGRARPLNDDPDQRLDQATNPDRLADQAPRSARAESEPRREHP
jgi:DNA-binding transcriptional MerR regulator